MQNDNAHACTYEDPNSGLAVTLTLPIGEDTVGNPWIGIELIDAALALLMVERTRLEAGCDEWSRELQEAGAPVFEAAAVEPKRNRAGRSKATSRPARRGGIDRTDKQIRKLKQAARDNDYSLEGVNDLSESLFGRPCTKLTRSETSTLIEHIEGVADKPGVQW